MVGLKPIYGGSIPSFLVSLIGLEQMQVPQKCGMEGGSHEVILRWWLKVLLIGLLV